MTSDPNLVADLGRELARTQALLVHVTKSAGIENTPTGQVILEQVERNEALFVRLSAKQAIDIINSQI